MEEREERELRLALLCTFASSLREARRVAKREAREELDMRLALEESGQDYWWSQLPPQLSWLRRPDSLQLLLQRPVWLAAWRRGEEPPSTPHWRRTPPGSPRTLTRADVRVLECVAMLNIRTILLCRYGKFGFRGSYKINLLQTHTGPGLTRTRH